MHTPRTKESLKGKFLFAQQCPSRSVPPVLRVTIFDNYRNGESPPPFQRLKLAKQYFWTVRETFALNTLEHRRKSESLNFYRSTFIERLKGLLRISNCEQHPYTDIRSI
jgi:hypothetical protein